MVDVTATDGRSERYTIADLADAYAAGDTERRAAFLVSLQRKASATDTETECDTATANCAPSNQALWAGDASAANAAPDQYRSATLAAIVRWAADHVGSQRSFAHAQHANDAAAGDKEHADGAQAENALADGAQTNRTDRDTDSERRVLFDPWQAGMQVPEWLRALGDVFRP
jgi:hypothetical protein